MSKALSAKARRINAPSVSSLLAAYAKKVAPTKKPGSWSAEEARCSKTIPGTLIDLVEAEKRTSLDAERLKRYFLEELNFTMTADHLRGLAQFRSALSEYGILP